LGLIALPCFLPRDSVTDTLNHGIDSRIDFGRNFFESSSLLRGKDRSNSFGQVSALQGEIGFDLCDPASLRTNGVVLHRRGVNGSTQGAALLHILFHKGLEAWLRFAQDCMNLSFLILRDAEFAYLTKDAISEWESGRGIV
jgi:hypothetical protein